MNGNTLSNKAGIILTGNWSLPTVGTRGTIQNTITGDNGYLMVLFNETINDGFAVEEGALDVNDSGQQWERSTDDDSGYFTLKNSKSGKILTEKNTNKHKKINTLLIEGTASFLCDCSCFFTMLFFNL